MVIGLLITVITGVSYVTKEKVVDIGQLEITKDKNNRMTWSPIAGVIMLVVGGGILLVGLKK